MGTRAFSWFGQHAPAMLAAGIFIGLIAQDLAHLMRPLLPVSIAALMILAGLRIRIVDVQTELLHPRMIALCLGMLLICPVLMWWLCTTLGLPAALTAAMVLGAALPSLFSAPSMALLFGLDGALAMAVLLMSTLATPFTLALVAWGLLDFDLVISPLVLMLRLAAFMGGCIIISLFIRRLMGVERIQNSAPQLDGISVLVLLTFAISIMDGLPALFIADPARILGFTVAAFAMNLGLQAFTTGSCLAFGMRRALTLGFISGNRSLGLLLAVLPASADPGLALFFILGQFPIYILPAALAPVYRRLLIQSSHNTQTP